MNKHPWKKMLLVCLTAISYPSVSLPLFSPPAIAQSNTALPMRLSFGEGYGSIVVPDRDTTAPAYGGRLRVYDVHIAKMFEVTHYLCQQRRVSPGITWSYQAGNGSIDMGTFQVTCRLANQLASAYGLGNPEPTAIRFSQEEMGPPITRNFQIPIFSITGDKVERWLDFVQGFSPVGN